VTAGAEVQSGSLVWQTRLSREAAAAYEQDLEILGLDRSEALRRGLRLLHREALEVRMARDVAEFYPGGRAPVSDVTAAAYPDRAEVDAPDGPSADGPAAGKGAEPGA
jgi:hypothetical protein